MASNVQAGTRGLSAGDWIRLKRLQGARNYQTDKDSDITNSTLRLEPESGRRVYTEFGTSKIRRPASSWTDFIASQKADYVLESQNAESKSRSLTANKCVCGFTTTVDLTYSFVIRVTDLSNITVGDAITFTNIVVEGDIIKNSLVVYVHSIYDVGNKEFLFTLTPNGDVFDILTQDPTTDLTGATVTILTPKPITESAIKHNGLCVKCIHS